MATTIQSGYANSPKLTADVASRAEVNGGRGLVFDGVADGLQCTSAYIHDKLDSSSHFTSSIWMKPADITATEGTIFSQHDRNAISIMQHGSGYLIYLNNNIIINGFNNGTFANGVWHHFVVTYDKTNVKVYLNGLLISTTSATYTLASHSNNIHYVGNRQNANYFNGTLTDFKLFDTALTEAQVQELYKNPENTPSAVQDNLIWWLPMIEGNPESPQSIVYDHSEKKLGSSIATSLTWTNYSFETLTSDGNSITVADNTSGHGICHTSVFSVTAGKTYKITFNFTLNSGSFSGGVVRVGTVTSMSSGNHTLVTSPSNGLQTYYFTPSSSSSSFLFGFRLDSGSFNFSVSDLSIQEVLMGNHATTNFFGNELFDADASTVDSGTHSWVAYAGATMTNDSGAIKVVCSTSNGNGAYLKFSDALDLTTDLTVGRTYRFSCSVKVDTGDVRLNMSDATGFSYHDVTETSFTTKTMDFVAGHATDTFVYVHRGQNSTIWLDNFSLKEIGISSSGFATAQNEPTIPQIPLVKYAEKMLFDGVDDKIDLTTSSPRLGTSDFSISFWLCTLTTLADVRLFGSDNSSTTQWSVHGEGATRLRWNGGLTAISAHSATFNDGKLRHIVISADRSGNLIYYVDGVLLSSHNISSDSTVDLKSIRYIGTYGAGTSSFSQMDIFDDFSLWNYALSATEVQELFNDGVALDATTHSKANDYLLGYWRNDGVTTWTDRGDIQAIGFDGSDDYIISSSNINITGSSVFSMGCWFKPTSASLTGFVAIIAFSDVQGHEESTLCINSGKLGWNNQHADGDTYDTTTSLSADTWHYGLVTFNGSDTIKLYLNGSLIFTRDNVSNVALTADPFYIGKRETGNNFTGLISQVAVWNKTLSAPEISAIYALGRRNVDLTTSYSANLKGYWLLNPTHSNPDLTGSNKILDRSTNSNHGTQNGGVSFLGANDGDVQGSPEAITIREGLNSNKDGLGFPLKNPTSNVVRFSRNGLAEHLSIPTTKGFDIQEAFTVECWFKQPDMGTGYQHMINRDDSANSHRNWLIMSTNGAIEVGLFSGGSYSNTVTSGTYDDDNWHHLCAVITTGTSVQIYIDTVLAKLNTTSIPTTIDNDPAVFNIGKRSGTTQFFIGSLDEVRFYNKALTAFEADGSAPEEGETATSGEVVKNYKHGKGKHKND